MSTIFQQNKKMLKAGVLTYNFSLPAVSTCPGAGACKTFCFALLEQSRYPSALAYRERMLELSKSDSFGDIIGKELTRLLIKAKGKRLAIRVHASGDFYSPEYLRKWIHIVSAFPSITFYAYTKSIAIAKRLREVIPGNFILIYSMGSNQDALINPVTDRHSRIFKTETDALAAGYTLANEDDAVAWSADTTCIGLVMFGARKNKGNTILGNNVTQL